MDNLSLIEQKVDTDIDPNGAPGSILAFNHNAILKQVLSQLGKYTGSPFIAVKNTAVVPTGIFSWNGNAMNNVNQFTISVSKLTSDLNDFTAVLNTLTTGSVIRFKDYVGRSVFFDFVSFSADVDTALNPIYKIEVKGRATNPNYIYQDTEQQICILEVLIKAIGYSDVYSTNFFRGSYEHVSNYDYIFNHIQSYIDPELNNDFVSEPITLENGGVTFDRFDTVVWRNDGHFYILKGDETADPFPKDIGEENEVFVVAILVKSGTTAPPDVTNETVYFDALGEPTEWNATGTANVITNDTGDASVGTNSIKFTLANLGDDVTLDNLEDLQGGELSNLTFDIKNINAVNMKLWIRLYFGNTFQVSERIVLQHATYGFDAFNTTDWQTITIPSTDLNMQVFQYNKLLIQNKRSGASFRLDNIKIQQGLTPIVDGDHVKRTSEIINDGSNASDNQVYMESDLTGALNGQIPVWNGSEFVMQDVQNDVKTIETTLPAEIIIDGTKDYHIESGIIKISNSGNIEGKDVEIVSNPNDGDSLVIDLTNFPHVQLQGGGFTESPANYYTLETDLGNSLLKQHLTLALWRRNNLFISNSMNFIPTNEITFSTVTNITNTYVDVSFNKVIQSTDLVIVNFNETFTQNGDIATGVTLDSITDSSGVAISGNEQNVRIYFTITGTTNGLATFTITALSVSDLFGNTVTNVVSNAIALIYVDAITSLSNVIAYWKEGEGDNTTGIATKTDVKNSKVLSASGEGNPTLSLNEWQFNGVDEGFKIIDTSITDLFNVIAKNCQIHYIGSYDLASSSRIVTITSDTGSSNNTMDLAYKSGTGNLFLNLIDASGNVKNQDLGIALSLSQTYLTSLKFHQKDLGGGVVTALDVYIDNGTTVQSILDIDLSILGVFNNNILCVGMRDIATSSYYNINFKSMVIANSSADFDTIRTELAL